MRRPGSPFLGFSILTTSAPSQASASVLVGPASNWVRSTTRTPLRQLSGAKFPLIPNSPRYGTSRRNSVQQRYRRSPPDGNRRFPRTALHCNSAKRLARRQARSVGRRPLQPHQAHQLPPPPFPPLRIDLQTV